MEEDQSYRQKLEKASGGEGGVWRCMEEIVGDPKESPSKKESPTKGKGGDAGSNGVDAKALKGALVRISGLVKSGKYNGKLGEMLEAPRNLANADAKYKVKVYVSKKESSEITVKKGNLSVLPEGERWSAGRVALGV